MVDYNCGAIQASLSPDKPMNTVSIVGNTEDLLVVRINAPTNLAAIDEKSEHVHAQGAHFAQRSQFHGQFLHEHCVFSNFTDANHVGQLGGKPAGATSDGATSATPRTLASTPLTTTVRAIRTSTRIPCCTRPGRSLTSTT